MKESKSKDFKRKEALTIIADRYSDEEEEYNFFNSYQKIYPIIYNFLSTFPEALVDMIMEYIPDDPSRELLIKITRKLGISEKNLNFYDDNFLNELGFLLKINKIKLFNDELFCGDLRKLLFRNILYLRQEKLINAINDEFKRLSEEIESIIYIIDGSFPSIYYGFDLESIGDRYFEKSLLDSEFFESSNYLAHHFANALYHVYIFPFYTIRKNGKLKKRKKMKRITCQDFKIKFFKNGDPNTDLLLKYFMIDYDYERGLIKECLKRNTQLNYSNFNKEFIKVIDDIRNLRIQGVEYFTGIPEIKYMTNSIIRLLLLNKRKIWISNGIKLYHLLQRMEEANLLLKEKIESIVVFGNDRNHLEWNVQSFRSHLECYLKHFSKDNEKNFIRKCLNLFKKSSRKSCKCLSIKSLFSLKHQNL